MEITEDQVEWAVIVRLRDMLRESRTAKHDVTMAFAMFSSIVCWIAQRMRAKGQGPNDVAARRFQERMRATSFGRFEREEEATSQNVAEAIILIRNAVAHLDGRSIRPLCRATEGRPPRLVGYMVEAARGEGPAILLQLSPAMMIRFGTWIADEFIAEMTRDAQGKPQPTYASEVNRGVREARA